MWLRLGIVIIIRENIMDVMSKIYFGLLVFWVIWVKEGVIFEIF